ncbi:hypothetical protein VB715_10365 [Crocosphaera sp. UHCC 0190]|uniref:hypothetical protein n=1 Tax=Crocosphaera sp. UHCC 0190 TaxID=3110246 RepID=UPI002B1F1C06|nr:hypothetical protein [Crocosphaera sp. UHCC 0190]MEA5510165.1 hypothetical protein [Crocosphaera sp. UHCC 0190]
MKTKIQTKIIHEGEYMAEIEVTMTYNDDEWSPYLSLEDAEKLDNVRLALRQNDLKTAAKLACIYHLTPVRVY